MRRRALLPVGPLASGVAAACLALAGCADSEITWFRVAGNEYAVPTKHVRSIRREPPGFIRINDPDSPIELVFDARLAGRTDRRGAPLLFSINERDHPRLVYRRTPEGALVVCRVATAAPRGGCGTLFRDDGAAWAVLFSDTRLGEADALRRRARSVLAGYRRL